MENEKRFKLAVWNFFERGKVFDGKINKIDKKILITFNLALFLWTLSSPEILETGYQSLDFFRKDKIEFTKHINATYLHIVEIVIMAFCLYLHR